MLVAFPSDAPGGLEAALSAHFGHCDVFTLVEVDDGKVGAVSLLPNAPHEHGGCLSPVTALAERGVQALVAGGMGARPLAGFQDAGIKVLHCGEAGTVAEAAELVAQGAAEEFAPAHTCGGGGGCGGHGHGHGHGHGCGHHHEPIQREVVEGPVEDGRVVLIAYRLTGDDGEVIDESEGLSYMHGAGNIVPGLERALTGKVAGDTVDVTLDPEDAYGEHEEERVMEVPVGQLPDSLSVGDMLQAQLPNGQGLRLVVLEIGDAHARLDANHPLAGKTLHFEVEVRQVMKAAPQDMA